MSFRTNADTVRIVPPGGGAPAAMAALHCSYDPATGNYRLFASAPPQAANRAGFVLQPSGDYLLSRNPAGAPTLDAIQRGDTILILTR